VALLSLDLRVQLLPDSQSDHMVMTSLLLALLLVTQLYHVTSAPAKRTNFGHAHDDHSLESPFVFRDDDLMDWRNLYGHELSPGGSVDDRKRNPFRRLIESEPEFNGFSDTYAGSDLRDENLQNWALAVEDSLEGRFRRKRSMGLNELMADINKRA